MVELELQSHEELEVQDYARPIRRKTKQRSKRSLCLGIMIAMAAVVVAFAVILPVALTTAHATYTVIQVSDIHFDATNHTCSLCADKPECLLQGPCTAFGCYGCDSSAGLLNASLMAVGNENPRFVIFTGDSAAHHATGPDVVEREIAAVGAAAKEFIIKKGIPFFAMLGNDDFYPDYNATCYSHWYSVFLSAFEASVYCENCELEMTEQEKAQNEQTVLLGGYYFTRPITGVRVITLNTVLYTPRGPLANTNDPCGQLAWFRSQLTSARENNERVFLAAHVPPGSTVYEYIHRTEFQDILEEQALWHRMPLNSFLDILSGNWDIIAMAIFGHTHRDAFRLLQQVPEGDPNGTPTQPGGGALVSPSISPIYFNNPGFRKYSVLASSNVAVDASMVYTELPILNNKYLSPDSTSILQDDLATIRFNFEYSMKDAFNVPGDATFPYSILKSVASAIAQENTMFWKWLSYNAVLYDAAKNEYQCLLTKTLNSRFNDCLYK